MSHIIIEIKNKILKIKLNDKINKLKKEDIIKIFCLINTFNTLEKTKGNEYNSAYICVKYFNNMLITEHINIFKLVRCPNLYEFVKYFIKINEKFDKQNTETKLDLNDYFDQTNVISQKILIIMVFDIESTEEEINKKSKKLLNILKINNINNEIFNIIENEK